MLRIARIAAFLFAVVLAALFLLALPAAAAPGVPVPPAGDVAAEARAIVAELVDCGARPSLAGNDPHRGADCGHDVVVRHFKAINQTAGGRLKVFVDRFQATAPRTGNVALPMENVYAVFPGRDPVLTRRAYVIFGYLDTDAPGADDASGIAVSILVGKAMTGEPQGYRATLVFAAVAGEEQGPLGFKRMKEWLALQGYEVSGMILCDRVGAANGFVDRRPRMFSGGGIGSDELARLAEELAGRDHVRLIFDAWSGSADPPRAPFLIPVPKVPEVRVTEPLEDDHHQHQMPRVENGSEHGDLPQLLDYPFIADVVALNRRLLADLAGAPEAPGIVVLELCGMWPSAYVKLTFVPPAADPDRRGFQILQQETDSRWSVLCEVAQSDPILMARGGIGLTVRSVGKNGAFSLPSPALSLCSRP